MSKTYARFICGLFVIFLGGLLIWHIVLPDAERSETENRSLAQRPDVTLSTVLNGKFMDAVEDWFTDQFPLRDAWTGLRGRAEQLLGKREFHGVYLHNRRLLAKVDTPDPALLSRNMSALSKLAAKAECPVTLGFIPSAAAVWELPDGAESWDQPAFLAQTDALGIPTAPIYAAMSEHSGEAIYYHTDHHWTTLGAFYGVNALLGSLGQTPLDPEDFIPETVSTAFQGTLYSKSGIHWLEPDAIEIWVPEEGLTVTSWRSGKEEPGVLYDRDRLTLKDKYSFFLGGNQPLCVIRNDSLPDSGKLLLIRDSYADAAAPFLAQRFSEVHLLDLRYYRASPAAYAAEHGITDIVVLYSIPNFITDTNIPLLAQ